MCISWTEKYKPKEIGEIAAQGRALREIWTWVKKWESGKPKDNAMLFYGPPGTGKSSTANAISIEMDWDLIELNASDKRTKKEIERIAGAAGKMGSLTGGDEKRLIVLDEADNVHGNVDRGGYNAISKLIRETHNPVILIGNDRYDIPMNIRSKSKEINFRRLRASSIAKALRHIAEREGINADFKLLKELGKRSNGDLRSAINDFQAIAEGKKKLSLADLSTSDRNRDINIFKALGKLKTASNCKEAREVLWDLDINPDDTIDWIEENIPKMFRYIPDIAGAYEALARADVFLGRVNKKQIYSLWSYASDLMSAGVAISREGKAANKRFSYPTSRKLLGRSRKKRGVRDGIAAKIADKSHTSKRRAVKDHIPYLSIIFDNDGEMAGKISKQLELERAEINYLKKFP